MNRQDEIVAADAQPTRSRTRLEIILPDVLHAMGWRRADAVYDSALPEEQGVSTLDDAALMLALLDLGATVEPGLPRGWDDGLDGAVVALSGEDAVALVRVKGAETALSSADLDDRRVRSAVNGADRVLYIRNLGNAEAIAQTKQVLLQRIRSTMRYGLLLSFFVNALAALIPIFSMVVFDRVLGARAPESLLPLISGAAVTVLCVLLLRRARARLLAAQHARLTAVASLAAEIRLMRMPFQALQRQSVESIDGRINSIRRVADLFASANTPAVFDAPFIIISIVLMAFIGGVLALAPAVYLVLFVAVAFAIPRSAALTDPELARAASKRLAYLHELSIGATDIRESGATRAWLTRFSDVSKMAARGAHQTAVRQGAVQSLGAILGTGAALATLAIGVDLAMTGVITSGALVGTMLLTWRITGPAQAFFLALPRLRTARSALNGLDKSLAVSTITTPAVALEHMPLEAPAVEAAGAFFRYDNENDAAIAGVSFAVQPGSVTIVMGPNGSGKTTLLRLLAGMLTPQSGQVRINNTNLRQYDPDEVMLSTLFLPAIAERGAGHGPQWTMDDGPTWVPAVLTDGAIRAALGGHGAGGAPSGPAVSPASTHRSFVLLDEPTARADDDERAAFLQFLASARGNSTVLFATHDTSLVSAADHALILNRGVVAYFGAVETNSAPDRPVQEDTA